MERSHSGLVRTLGKRVNLQGFRGFESPSLRHDLYPKKWTRKQITFHHLASSCQRGTYPAHIGLYLFPQVNVNNNRNFIEDQYFENYTVIMRITNQMFIGIILICTILTACSQQENTSGRKNVSHPDIAILDYAATGEKDAPVIFVEYSDYQCPFCRKFTTETLPRIIKEYVDTGVVRFVFKDYPLEIHDAAVQAAVAAHCAGEQEMYYLYHDVLFEKAAERGTDFSTENFIAWAESLNLNTESFASCLQDDQQVAKVLNSVAEAKGYGVQGTPSFLINGRLLKGPQPFAAFVQVIDSSAKKLPQIEEATCNTDADCKPANSFSSYCSKSAPNEVCITTGTPTCKLPGTAESECVMIITEECTSCPSGQQCTDGQCAS
jgi:protein-disulfide isomerase